MIYSGSWVEDYDNILRHLNSFTAAIGLQGVQVDTELLQSICLEMYQNFPQSEGHVNSSAFKKVGTFVALFMHYKPIKAVAIGYQVGGIADPDLNAVVALDIAIIALEESVIHKAGGVTDRVSKPIYLSDHSYADAVDALSLGCEEPKNSYHMLAIYFEQLVYKTNRHCEYRPHVDSSGVSLKGFYQEPCPVSDGDCMEGV